MSKQRQRKHKQKRGTPPGTHVPVMVPAVLRHLAPAPGETVVDCTVGYGGHAEAMLKRIGEDGTLVGIDRDGEQLERTRARLARLGGDQRFVQGDFAHVERILQAEGIDGAELVFADLGSSSMQVDDPQRGFSYKHTGPLDMRMDLAQGPTAAELLAEMPADQLSAALRGLAEEPDHETIAQWIVNLRQAAPLKDVQQLVRLVLDAKGIVGQQRRNKSWERPGAQHPAARTFQALRILVNDELRSLEGLLAAAPRVLKPGGRIGILSFHNGEDRLVKQAFRDGYEAGIYQSTSPKPLTPSKGEAYRNYRSTSAKFRWAVRAE